MSRWIVKGLFVLTFAGVSAAFAPKLAHADAIAPDEASCTGKTAGAECVTNGVAGHCTAKKCNKLDYSDGSPPSTKEVDCLVCVAMGVADASASDGSASGDSGSNGNGSNADSGASSNTGSSGSSSNSGCSLTRVPGARTVGPWLLALLPLIVLRKRGGGAKRAS